MEIAGSCHCGNVRYVLDTQKAWDDITLRTCHCGFCLRHRPRYWSDPQGGFRIEVDDPDRLRLYRFGHGTADFTLCLGCGVFCFAVAEAGGIHRAVVNLNLALSPDDRLPERLLEASDETPAERDARRSANWMPLTTPWPPGSFT